MSPRPVSFWEYVGTVALIAAGCALVVGGLWLLRGRRMDHVARVKAEQERAEKQAAEHAAQLGSLHASGVAQSELVQAVQSSANPSAPRMLRPMSEPTRLVVGIGLLLVGYHALAYALPASWLPLRVPIDRLWMLGAGVVCAAAISAAMDRLTEQD